MSAKDDILTMLNDETEPLPKRLKLANSVLKTPWTSSPDWELSLLHWLTNADILTSLETWQICCSWINSAPFQQMSPFHIKDNHMDDLISKITIAFTSENDQIVEELLNVVTSMIDCPPFHYYLRLHSEKYLVFICNISINISSVHLLTRFWKSEQLLSKKMIAQLDFSQIFMERIFAYFVVLLMKHNGNSDLFNVFSHVVQRQVFIKTEKEYENAFSALFASESPDLHIVEKLLANLIRGEKPCSQFMYHYIKLLFNAFGETFKTKPKLTYPFFIIVISNSGFSVQHFENLSVTESIPIPIHCSLVSICALMQVTSRLNLKFDAPTNKISFDDLLKQLLSVILSTTKCPINEHCYELINLIVDVDPMAIEANISQILVYFLSRDNGDNALWYSKTVCNILKIFHKLHRLPNLISKLIRALQPVYLNETIEHMEVDNDVKFVGKIPKSLRKQIANQSEYVERDVNKILPESVIEQYSKSILTLPSKQVAPTLKTFIFHMDELISIDSSDNEANYVCFIEIVSQLMCQFMSKMNLFSTYFRSDSVMEKFDKLLTELEAVLGKFGNALVATEHNLNLMRVFLNLTYECGEFKLMLQNSIKENAEKNETRMDTKDLDVSTCNISLLHPYLSSQTWCLIAERISNFGEQPCKGILEKLWLQKIRGLVLAGVDQSTIQEHIASLIQKLTPIEDYYQILLNDDFAANKILPQMDMQTLVVISANLIQDLVDDVPKGLSPSALKNHNCNEFTLAILHCVCKKIHKLLMKDKNTISGKIFHQFESAFLTGECDAKQMREVSLPAIKDFKKEDIRQIDVKYERIMKYLNILRQSGLLNVTKESQIFIFHFLLGVFFDLKYQANSDQVLKEVETILFGMTQSKLFDLDDILPTSLMLKTILKNFEKSKDIFANLLNNISVNIAEKTISYVAKHLDDEKCLICFLIFMKFMQKKDIDVEAKKLLTESKITLLTTLTERIVSEYKPTQLILFVELLQSQKTIPEEVIARIRTIAQEIFENTTEIKLGELKFLQYILSCDSAIIGAKNGKVIDNVASALHTVQLNENVDILNAYASNVNLIIHKIEDSKKFAKFVEQVFLDTTGADESVENYRIQTEIWRHLLVPSIQPEKFALIQKFLDLMILNLHQKTNVAYLGIVASETDEYFDMLIKFNLHMIQTTQHPISNITFDMCFATITHRLYQYDAAKFESCYLPCIELLATMLKCRPALVSDRIPLFMQAYRLLVKHLCRHSDTAANLSDAHYDRMAELAHSLERLSNEVRNQGSHVAIVADVTITNMLTEYETISIYPAVKLALNNCVYNLIALCNKRQIAHIKRTLSPGSAQIFNGLYANYKKYHRFTGKV